MKHFYVFIVLGLFSISLSAQQQQVVSTSGQVLTSGSGSISFTLGECVIATLDSPSLMLTQGFHQTFIPDPDPGGLAIEAPELDFEIKVFPNPVRNHFTLKVTNPKGFSYVLYDMNGLVLLRKQIDATETDIYLEDLPPAIYVLKVYKESLEVKIIKITKQ